MSSKDESENDLEGFSTCSNYECDEYSFEGFESSIKIKEESLNDIIDPFGLKKSELNIKVEPIGIKEEFTNLNEPLLKEEIEIKNEPLFDEDFDSSNKEFLGFQEKVWGWSRVEISINKDLQISTYQIANPLKVKF